MVYKRNSKEKTGLSLILTSKLQNYFVFKLKP